MAIALEILISVARRGSWNFSVDLRDGSDEWLSGADGTDDIDRILALMDRLPYAQVMLDIGAFDQDMQPASVEDVQLLRDAYVTIYGDVPKPPLRHD